MPDEPTTPPEPGYLDSIEAAFNQSFPQGVPPPNAPPQGGTPPPSGDTPPTAPPAAPAASPIEQIIKDKEAAAQTPVDDEARKAMEEEAAKLTEGLSEAASVRFKKIHARAWEAEQKAKQLDQLQQQLEQMKSKSSSEDVEALKAKIKTLDETLRKTNLIEHPEFVQQYAEPIEKAVKAARYVAGPQLADDVEAILRAPDSPARATKIDELLDGMSAYKATRLTNLIAEVDQVHFERQEAIKNWQETEKAVTQRAASTHQNALTKASQEISQAVDSVLARASDRKSGVEVFMEVPGNEEWNQSVRQLKSEVRRIAESNIQANDFAELVTYSVSAKKYRDLFMESFKELQGLRAEVAKLKSAGPTMSDTPRSGGEIDSPSTDSYINAIDMAAREAGLIR